MLQGGAEARGPQDRVDLEQRTVRHADPVLLDTCEHRQPVEDAARLGAAGDGGPPHPRHRDDAARRQSLPHALLDPGDSSEEHTSELQSLMRTSYAVFCYKKKKRQE